MCPFSKIVNYSVSKRSSMTVPSFSKQGGKMPAETVLMVQNLFKSYFTASGEVPILKKITFKVSLGEFVCIVGPSGSGKSTLLNILGTLDRQTSGKIFINDVDT